MQIDELINMRIGEICATDGVSKEEACDELMRQEPWMKDAVKYWEEF